MTTDTIAQIKAAEKAGYELVEKTRQDGEERIRAAKARCESRIAEENEKLRSQLEDTSADAVNESHAKYNEDEIESYHEAEKFVRQASARLPDAVRFIVGGIIGKWQ